MASDMQVDAEWAGQVVDWLDQRRHSVAPFLEEIHVNRHELGHGEKVSAANLAAIMEFGEACIGDHHFGLHRGDEFRPEIGGLLAYVAMCSETVEEAFDNLKRYVSISSESFAIDLNKDQASCKLVLHVSDPVWAGASILASLPSPAF
jgi:Arabinose-binding domain of AraC transcription regulator, N-term